MKILYPLLCYYPSQAGGPANTIYWLNKALTKLNIEQIVISTKYGLSKEISPKDDLFIDYNIDVEFVSNSIFSFLHSRQLKKLSDSSIIHFSSLFFKPTFFYILFGLLMNKFIVLSPRGELYDSALSRKPLVKKLYIFLISLFQKHICFHATNDYEAELILNYFPKAKEIITIPNFIELPVLHKVEKKNQILYLGRINPIKNIHLLIEAFSILPEELQNKFKLILVGKVELEYENIYHKELMALIDRLDLNSKVQFLGAIYGEQKEKILAESYCTVLPSKSENFGNVVLESLCQGTPVIASKNTPWVFLEKYNAGAHVEANVTCLANSIQNILMMEEQEYIKMQENAVLLAKTEFDISHKSGIWFDFYKSLVNPI